MQLLPNHVFVLLYETTNSLIKKYANLPTIQYNCLNPILKVFPLVDIPKRAIYPLNLMLLKNSFVKEFSILIQEIKNEECSLNTYHLKYFTLQFLTIIKKKSFHIYIHTHICRYIHVHISKISLNAMKGLCCQS